VLKIDRVWKLLRFIVIAGSLLCSLTIVGLCRPQETAEQFVERVKKAIKNEEWGRAKSGIKHALALNPESADANLIAAQVYWHEGARSMAIDALKKAIAIQPIFPEAHFLLAQCLKESNQLGGAREEAHIAINQGASLFPAYRLLAEIDIAQGDFDAAINWLDSAIRVLPMGTADSSTQQEEMNRTRKLSESLKQLAVLAADQNSRNTIRPFQLNSPQPRYTEEARGLKVQGSVFLGVVVTENGDVGTVLLLRGLGHGLDERATEVARNLKFAPATRNGIAIPYWMKLIVEFNLR